MSKTCPNCGYIFRIKELLFWDTNNNDKCPGCEIELSSRVSKKVFLFILALFVFGVIKFAPLMESPWHWSYLLGGVLVYGYISVWFQKFEIKSNS